MPSAFYTPRHDQWDVLVQSAALDNLLYVVALNQYNEHFFGRSCIADPCGLIVSKVSDQEGIMYGILDMNYQQTVRSQVPVSYTHLRAHETELHRPWAATPSWPTK